MRYFIKIDLQNKPVPKTGLEHARLQKYLPLKTVHKTGPSVFLQTFRYESRGSGVIDANWERPFFENNAFFMFVGGHVLFRLNAAEKSGTVVPTPEEICELIVREGENHYRYLKGNYYLLLVDKKKGSIVIYSSPLSLYPVYFTLQADVLAFSNILEWVLPESAPIAVNVQGLVEFALFDHPLGMNTLYRNIHAISGGTRIDISNNRFKETVVYDIAQWIHGKPISRREALPEISHVLRRVMADYTAPVSRFNLSLTGGFDGRLNLSLIHERDYPRMQTFSYAKSGSLQLSIPKKISEALGFGYKPILLDEEFVGQYAELGHETIMVSEGITPFIRANYLYGYGKLIDFSRYCILGQCDMIRPLYTNPAGAIFNKYSRGIFYQKNFADFLLDFNRLRENGFLKKDLFSDEMAEMIFNHVKDRYVTKYPQFTDPERYFLFLYKESMVKFWQTECHVVDLLVDDFISFADLDYLETLAASEYFGLYKGIFAANQFKRRTAHDLYIDLMALNNDRLNDFSTDRLFKPKWLKYGLLGLVAAFVGKNRAKRRFEKSGNDTFGGLDWSNLFYDRYKNEIKRENELFELKNMANQPYADDNLYRLDRHLSLKLWFDHLHIGQPME
jgi:hypothetical protein